MHYKKSSFAIDIGNSSVKFLKFRHHWSGPEIIDARVFPLPLDLPTVIDEGKKTEIWKNALIHLLQGETEPRPRNVTVSLPGDATIVRYITLPNIPPSKIDKIIRFEAEQQVPIPFNEIEWSYAVLPSRRKKVVDVVITAAKKKLISPLTDIIQSFNFKVDSFRSGQLALCNLVKFYNLDKEGTLLIDLGAQSTHIIMFYKGMKWGRTLYLGMFKMTKMISEKLSIDLKEAEKMKKTQAHDGTFLIAQKKEKSLKTGSAQVVNNVIEDVLYEIVNEVSRTISYYLSVERAAVFNRIIITGGGSHIKHINTFFEKNLGLKTQIANFITPLKLSSYLEGRFNYDKNFYSITIGLSCTHPFFAALKAPLLTHALREERILDTRRERFYFFFIITLFILFTLAVNFTYELSVKRKKEKLIKTQLAQIEKNEVKMKKIENNIKNIKNTLMLLELRSKEREYLLRVLWEIEALLLDNVWFDVLEFQKENQMLIISGRTTETLANINNFQSALRGLDFIKDVTFEAAHIEEETMDGKPIRIFTIKVRFIPLAVGIYD